jgi:3-oxoacyl-[acyl-carrier protein] reductase
LLVCTSTLTLPQNLPGIGAEIARELARQGASVLITYARSAREAAAVVEELERIKTGANARFKAVQADAAKALEAAEKTTAEATALFESRGIDIIINNAANGEDLDLSAVTPETFDACFHPNVLFPLLLVKLSKPVLRKKARIVNLSSAGARVGQSGFSKDAPHALFVLTRSLILEDWIVS